MNSIYLFTEKLYCYHMTFVKTTYINNAMIGGGG